MTDLGGRTAIVVGGGQGIGRGVALALASAGATVVVADLRATKANDVASEVASRGTTSVGVACDVRDGAEIASVVSTTVDHFGGVDILVNAAIAKFTVKPLMECTVDEMQDMVASGLIGVTTFMQAAHPWLKASG